VVAVSLSLSLDVSADRRWLYVHSMFVEQPDSVRSDIKDGFERRVLELLR
jgi:multicomponent Na+:H+ antiporter subunit E